MKNLDFDRLKKEYSLCKYGFHIAEKSKFYALEFYVENLEKFNNIKKELKLNVFEDCTHLIYAAIFDNKEMASEDGEVGKSSKKILFSLTKQKKKNVAIFIARYFGGTLLGVGGVEKAFLSAFKSLEQI